MSSVPSFCGWVTVPQAANPSWLSQQLPVLLDGDFLSSMGATRAGHAHWPGSAFPISGCCLGSDLRKRQERWVSWSWPGSVFLLQGLDATSRLLPVPSGRRNILEGGDCPVFLLPLSPSVTQARGHLSLPEDRKLQ
uniref:PP6569 n=1 Tax=Homo sapiens TaxID=9606 RepID=Q71RB2_HUMAN|nr:PP6569 [Homo sapiens]